MDRYTNSEFGLIEDKNGDLVSWDDVDAGLSAIESACKTTDPAVGCRLILKFCKQMREGK